jgi:hypothetical protein
MGIGRAPAADQAWLRTDELAMRFIAFPNEFQKWSAGVGSTTATPTKVVVPFSARSDPCGVERVLTTVWIQLLGPRRVTQVWISDWVDLK